MSAGGEQWVLCGEATSPVAPADALRLAIGENLSVDIEGLTESLMINVPPVFKDLLRIAAYVLAADQAFYRGDPDNPDLGKRWRRNFHFVIPVERLDIWSSDEMRRELEDTLGFLSDDSYAFEFKKSTATTPEQMFLKMPKGKTLLPWERVNEIALFSGGLDSLGGAVEEILHNKRNVILVSHRSADKVGAVQKRLVEKFQERSEGPGPWHVAVRVQKHEKRLRKDRNQRSRSFLFAALAGTVASLVDLDRIRFYENGVASLHLPVSPQVVGARATRTTHPKVLKGFARILSLVAEKTFHVENPFELKTRAEIAQGIADRGAADLITDTISCVHVLTSSQENRHCGVCSQCIDRQFAIHDCGLEQYDPEDLYAIKLITDARPKEIDQTLVLDYVAMADRCAAMKDAGEFFSAYGEAERAVSSMTSPTRDAETVKQDIFTMLRRHGEGAGQVLKAAHARHDKDMRDGKLPPTSLLMLLFSQGLRRCNGPAPTASENPGLDFIPEYSFRQHGQNWLIRFRGGEVLSMSPSKGLSYLHLLINRAGEVFTAFGLVDLVEGREVGSHPLSTSLGIDQAAVDSVKDVLRSLQEERDEAAEFYHDDEVARIEAEMEQLTQYLKKEAGPDGKPRRESPEQKKARTAVSNAIKRATKELGKHSKPLANHLDNQVRTGFFLQYRTTDLPWET